MKMSRIALAMLVAAPMVAANAGITITPLMLGYHAYLDSADENIAKTYTGVKDKNLDIQDDIVAGSAIGAELTPWLQAEIEYQQTRPDAKYAGVKTNANIKHETASLNFIATSDLLTGNYDSKIKPYALLGAGWSRFNIEGGGASKDTIGNIGGGLLVQLNDALTLRGEARGVHNFDNNWWEAQALAGLQIVVGGHLKPAAPVVEVQPVEPQPQPVVEVKPEPEQPKEITEDLKMELRVFFDTNKSNIKDQYKPEVAKVAEKLAEYPNATAQIDGHTDNTGPRKLNERLSLARANSVKSALVNEFGVDANRLSTQGFAWDQPIADNNTKEGKAMNRRVFATISGSKTVLVQPGQ
ncbi:MAG: OmpA family protein [Acinetobacter sp.]|nr:MAG: OmpA family protein [Acinetobacter sp.]